MSTPLVIVPMGLPGSGKTTLVRALATHLRGHVVSRDAIRAAMFPAVEYTDAEKQAAFAALLLALRTNLELGRSTVLDGTCFSSRHDFDRVVETAEAVGIVVPLMCECPIPVARERVARDLRDHAHAAADRTPELVDRVAARFWDVPSDIPRIDMTADEPGVLRQALDAIAATTGRRP